MATSFPHTNRNTLEEALGDQMVSIGVCLQKGYAQNSDKIVTLTLPFVVIGPHLKLMRFSKAAGTGKSATSKYRTGIGRHATQTSILASLPQATDGSHRLRRHYLPVHIACWQYRRNTDGFLSLIATLPEINQNKSEEQDTMRLMGHFYFPRCKHLVRNNR